VAQGPSLTVIYFMIFINYCDADVEQSVVWVRCYITVDPETCAPANNLTLLANVHCNALVYNCYTIKDESSQNEREGKLVNSNSILVCLCIHDPPFCSSTVALRLQSVHSTMCALCTTVQYIE
jgi:hypothetical protein